MSMTQNRRGLDERIYLYQFLDVIDQHTNEQLGYLSDFSTGGIMFITNLYLSENQIKDIYISGADAEGEHVLIKAQIQTVWVKSNLNPEMLCIGCRFLDIDSENRQLLEKTGRSLSYDPKITINREVEE